jgi:tetratricopeptide (TPR) repeat protein
MTVRWKPLLVLSGVFLVTALGGVVAIAFVMMNASARDILPKARAEAKAGQYDRALIQYRRALQQAPKDPEIHEELAVMLAKWAEQAPAEKRPELLQQHYAALIDAVRFGPRAVGPRRALLTESLRLDEMGEAARWARELVSLAPEDPDAHFALAVDALKKGPSGTAEARKQIEHLGEAETQRVRSMWLVAWLAREERDEATLEKMMEAAREVDVARVADPSDRLAFLRLPSPRRSPRSRRPPPTASAR